MAPSDDLVTRVASRARRRWEEATQRFLAERVPRDSSSHGEADAVIDGALDRLAALEADRESHIVRELPARSRRTGSRVAIASAAAAAALLMWVLRPVPPPLPRYVEHAFEGGIKHARGDESALEGPIVLEPTSRIRWALAPATATKQPVGVRIEAVGHERRCVSPGGVRVSSSGAVELAGAAAEVLDLPPGAYMLTVLVGGADRLIALDDPCAVHSDGTRPDGVRAVASRSVEIRSVR